MCMIPCIQCLLFPGWGAGNIHKKIEKKVFYNSPIIYKKQQTKV